MEHHMREFGKIIELYFKIILYFKANGEGVFRYPDGDVYYGNFVMDHINGEGTYEHLNGARYVGMWKND